jgi:hypothetical protein
VRIPRIDDFGDVLIDSEHIESADLFYGKEIYLQILKPETNFEFMPPTKDNKDGYYVLFREWDSETWEFGPIIEVKVDK